MRHLWLLMLGFVSACQCGGLGAGAPCMTNTECASGRCNTAGRCTAEGTAGSSGSGMGGSGASSMGTGGAGARPGTGSTSGGAGGAPPCQNLQCQVAMCPGGAKTTITGKVYDPGGNVPLYNVAVYVPNKPVDALTSGPTCSGCGGLISGQPVAITLSGADGSFTLTDVPSGANIPLVIQIGKWRRQVTLPNVASCQTTALTDPSVTRLPRNKTEGNIPLTAIASGRADPFECLLRKIGIDDSEFTVPTGSGRIHYYVANGKRLNGAPAASTLWSQAATLQQYDVVILPCEASELRKPAQAITNMVNYANSGGRIFTTHYSYVWTQDGWPTSAAWQLGLMPDLFNSTFTVTVDQSFPKGQSFAQWLSNVQASTVLGSLDIRESRHNTTGVGMNSTRWLYGDIPASNPPASVQHFTFNTPYGPPPAVESGMNQCGRVVFSDFHVTAGAATMSTTFPDSCAMGSPLSGQEKALEFMLFDLSACVQDDTKPPMVCATDGQTCRTGNDCCTGLACADATGSACAPGATCTCQVTIN